jgi:hypothetical protein
LDTAELAVDLTNKRIYTKNSGGTVIELGTNGGSSTFENLTVTGDLAVDTNTLFVDASENKVGIGTSSPSRLLHLFGGDEELLRVQGTSAQLRVSAENANSTIDLDNVVTGGNLSFSTVGAERMRIDSNGNVGIGTASPSYKLDVQGSARVTTGSTGTPFIVESGGTAQGNIRFGSTSAEYGIYGGADYLSLQFHTNSNERMRIDNNGNVGIGASSPSTNNGTLVIGGVNTTNNNPQGSIVFADAGNNGQSRIRGYRGSSYQTGALAFEVAQGTVNSYVEAMRIDSSGNVGIGTDSPLTFISGNVTQTISDASATALMLETTNTNNIWYIANDTSNSNALRFVKASRSGSSTSSSSEAMRIDTSGNIQNVSAGGSGAFLANPNGYQVWGTSSSKLLISAATNAGNYNTNITHTSTGLELGTNSPSRGITFSTNSTERMRIDSSGNLMVGKTAVAFAEDGSAIRDGRLEATITSQAPLNLNRKSTTGQISAFYYNTVQVGNISVTASTTSYNPSSDERLKENIRDYDNALADVMKLKPRKYSWKADGAEDNGFIAQELLETPEFSNRVNPIGDGDDPMYGVDYMKFVAVLTGAIQEQQAMIEELKAEVAALKGA